MLQIMLLNFTEKSWYFCSSEWKVIDILYASQVISNFVLCTWICLALWTRHRIWDKWLQSCYVASRFKPT